jgi:voltage-gated potassium channel
MFVREICAAAVLILLTLWLQCGGIAMLITWFRGSVAGDTDKFGLFRTAVLIVRFTTAVVVLHLIEALVWPIFYRWFCYRHGKQHFTSQQAVMGPSAVVM